jgi:hypothetical protein
MALGVVARRVAAAQRGQDEARHVAMATGNSIMSRTGLLRMPGSPDPGEQLGYDLYVTVCHLLIVF